MTRDEIVYKVLKTSNSSIILEGATGIGKSYVALKKIDQLKPKSILIVIPRLVLIQNWMSEFGKWGYDDYLTNTKFVTYVSLPKFENTSYDVIIFDECHHLSDRCQIALNKINSKNNLFLSATISKKLRYNLLQKYSDLTTVKITLNDAINENILPSPKIILVSLQLDCVEGEHIYTFRKSAKSFVQMTYNQWVKQKASYYRRTNIGVKIICNGKEYYDLVSREVNRCKDNYMNNGLQYMHNQWMQISGKRLKWLSTVKEEQIIKLLNNLSSYRTLTFCSDIKQTEKLGSNQINSKNKKSDENLKKFNNYEIDHITACNMLDEGINLNDCQVGIFAYINSSERMQIQKIGRILRHKNPVIILPYFVNTREEEIVEKMLQQYDKSLIETQSNFDIVI